MSASVMMTVTPQTSFVEDIKPLEEKFLRVSLQSVSTQASDTEVAEPDFQAAMMQLDAEFESPKSSQSAFVPSFAVGVKQAPRKRTRTENFAEAVMELDAEFDQ